MKEICGIPLSNAELDELNFAAKRIDFGDGYPSPDVMCEQLDRLQASAHRYILNLEEIIGTSLGDSLDNRLPGALMSNLTETRRLFRTVSKMHRHKRPDKNPTDDDPKENTRMPEACFREFILVAARIWKKHGLKRTARSDASPFVVFVNAFYYAKPDKIRDVFRIRKKKPKKSLAGGNERK